MVINFTLRLRRAWPDRREQRERKQPKQPFPDHAPKICVSFTGNIVMRNHTAHHDVPEEVAQFLLEARRNLVLVRLMQGTTSPRYQSLRHTYRTVADMLGCRRAFERHTHRLARQPDKGIEQWQRKSPKPLRLFQTERVTR